MKKEITIQGMVISIIVEDNGTYYAPQWEGAASSSSLDSFQEFLGFKNPISALKEIGTHVLDMCLSLDKPVYFIGSCSKRTRVYAKMLRRCGFNFELVNEPIDGDLAINILFKE